MVARGTEPTDADDYALVWLSRWLDPVSWSWGPRHVKRWRLDRLVAHGWARVVACSKPLVAGPPPYYLITDAGWYALGHDERFWERPWEEQEGEDDGPYPF